MNIDPRRATTLKLLEKTGISRSRYEPHWLRLLWKFGFNIPPPHFASFWITTVFTGSFIGVLWSLVMWLIVWSREGKTLGEVALAAIVFGTCFGLANASYYAYEKSKHKLPSWQELSTSACDCNCNGPGTTDNY
jgi:hypothetical protein